MCVVSISGEAQTEANYWTSQYGSKGLLLNGAVISSPDGETSAFYNPGAIGMDDDLGFLFSFVTPTYSDLTVDNLLGEGNRVRDRGFGFAPGFFGLRVRPFNNKKITLALTNFKRFESNIRLDDRVVNQIAGSPDLLSRVDLDFRRKISESWRGIGLAYMLSDKIGIGLSQFSVWHKDQFEVELASEINSASQPTLLDQYYRLESAYRFNLSSAFITKLGFSYHDEKLCFGFTYTSPMYGAIYRNASYKLETQLVDPLSNNSSTISNRNSTSNITYRSPHSIGLGMDFHGKITTYSIAAEYFFGIANYKILNELDDSFDGLSDTNNETLFTLDSENEAVLNFAVGIQRKLSDRTTVVFGFRTDYSQNNKLGVNDNLDQVGIAGNVYHISGGNMITLKNSQFSCGFDFAFASRNGNKQIFDLNAISPATFPNLGGNENVNNRFRSFMIFLTYDFIFDKFRKG